MSSKSKKRPRDVSLNKAVTVALTIFLWAWVSCFDPTPEDMDKLIDELDNVRESVSTQRLRLSDIRQALKDEYDVEVLA